MSPPRLLALAALLPLLSPLATASASYINAGDIKALPLPNACSSYPKYDNTTGIAGPWPIISVADSANSTIGGLQVSGETFTNDGTDLWGLMTLPRASNYWTPNITLRCNTVGTQPQIEAILAPANDPNNTQTWLPITISTIPNWQASLSINLAPTLPVLPFAHYTNGTRLPGTYLGLRTSTQWFFKYNFGGVVGEYYMVRWGGGYDGLTSGANGQASVASASIASGQASSTSGLRKKGKRQDDGGFPPLDDRDWTGYLRVGE